MVTASHAIAKTKMAGVHVEASSLEPGDPVAGALRAS
jgi:hypothetical protein